MVNTIHGLVAYRYLHAGAGRDLGEAVEDDYARADLVRRVVVRDEYHRAYYVLRTWAEYQEWESAIPEAQRCFHEVIFGEAPQRLKFDIDAAGSALDAIPESEIVAFAGEAFAAPPAGSDNGALRDAKARAIMTEFVNLVADELCVAFPDDVVATPDDLVVMDASGPVPGGWKHSYHVVVRPFAVANHLEAKGFTERVAGLLPARIRGLLDQQVNRSLQNFRLLGSSKPNTGRVLRVTEAFGTPGAALAQTVVTVSAGARILPRRHSQPGPGAVPLDGGGDVARELTSEDLRKVLKVVAASGASAAHEYLRAEGTLLLFRRKAPSFCTLCGRTHHGDNTLMVALREAAAGPEVAAPWHEAGAPVPHQVVELCRRTDAAAAEGASRALGEVVIDPLRPFELAAPAPGAKVEDEAASKSERFVAARIEAIRSGAVDPHRAAASGFERLPDAQKVVYAEAAMRPYPAVKTLAVKAQMGLGKSRILREYIDREYAEAPGALRRSTIRFVSFRQTFAKSSQNSTFPDFELYSDHAGNLDRHSRLIVQVESLHRLQLGAAPEPVDLLVLDEVESILGQFNSGLHRHLNTAFAVFQWMVATADRVIVLDANLGDRTLNILNTMRGHAPIHFHWNQHQRAAADRYFVTARRAVWLDHLVSRLAAGQRVVVPTNSRTEARAIEEVLRARFPQKVVRLYSSDTPPSIKEKHFADVHTHWSDLDVLIYTPTVSAGVSYEMKHFDVLFGLFGNTSCDVETARQMLGRVRDIATREFVICLQGRDGNLPTAVDDIRRLVRDRRASLYRDEIALDFEYGPNGEIRYHESKYFSMWLETKRVENLSRNNFVGRFVDQVADTGAGIATLEALAGFDDREHGIRLGHSEVKAALSLADNRAVAEAPDLDGEEVAEIRERLQRQKDVAPEERSAVAKFSLRRTYAARGEITTSFVERYRPSGATRVFRNLQRITAHATIDESLWAIQQDERDNYHTFMEMCRSFEDEGGGSPVSDPISAIEARDLHRRYVFPQHRAAVCLLRLAGFRCITDRARVQAADVIRCMKRGEKGFIAAAPQIAAEFDTSPPNPNTIRYERDKDAYIKKMLRFTNFVLRRMYGIEIAHTGWTGGVAYFIRHTRTGRLFAFGPNDGGLPVVRSQLKPLDVRMADIRLAFAHGLAGSEVILDAGGFGPDDPDPGDADPGDTDDAANALDDETLDLLFRDTATRAPAPCGPDEFDEFDPGADEFDPVDGAW